MAVREKAGSFLNLCHSPEMAAEVTLQPVEILGVDAAILFSDILVVPNEMGMELEFIKGFGPKFPNPIASIEDVEKLQTSSNRLSYVYKTIELVKEKLPSNRALIGFAGSPWTLATYMIEGSGTKTYAKIKKMVYSNPELVHRLLERLRDDLIEYLSKQIEAGVDAVQIFDSWAAALEMDSYFEFSWRYMVDIAEELKYRYPYTPVILFPKGIAGYLDGVYGKFDVFGVDWGTPIELAKEKLGDRYVLQGNLEPTRLYSKEAIRTGVEKIFEVMKGRRHIFNLGHGILPDIDPENVKFLVELVHNSN
jgi:uroporphyrinogen decarboxylase